MHLANGSIEGYTIKEYVILGFHWTIELNAKWMYVAGDNPEDYVQNE
jgi:hypothetical protein